MTHDPLTLCCVGGPWHGKLVAHLGAEVIIGGWIYRSTCRPLQRWD